MRLFAILFLTSAVSAVAKIGQECHPMDPDQPSKLDLFNCHRDCNWLTEWCVPSNSSSTGWACDHAHKRNEAQPGQRCVPGGGTVFCSNCPSGYFCQKDGADSWECDVLNKEAFGWSDTLGDLKTQGGLNASSTKGVGLQAFGWDDLSNRAAHFANLESRASGFASDGFSYVWTPPPSQSVDSQGYMPGEWYTIEGESALKSFTSTLSSNGVKPVCDIVINHRTAPAKDSCNGEWISFKSPDWGSWGVVSNDAKCDSGTFCYGSCTCGSSDTGQNFCGAPDVDHTNSQVQSDTIAWLKWLKSTYKFAGWRFDFAVGYSPQYMKQYVQGAGGDFAVGEYWDTNVDNVKSWAASSGLHAFDFPQRFALKSAIAAGDFSQLKWGLSPLGFAGINPHQASTFLDNHDTARPSGQGGGDGGFGNDYAMMLGYAFILTHPAFPWVFLQHLDGNNGADIRKLIKIRNTQQISPADLPYIDAVSHGVYAVFVGTSVKCEGKLAMKVGPDDWSPCGTGWKVAASGSNWAVWTKSGEEVVV